MNEQFASLLRNRQFINSFINLCTYISAYPFHAKALVKHCEPFVNVCEPFANVHEPFANVHGPFANVRKHSEKFLLQSIIFTYHSQVSYFFVITNNSNTNVDWSKYKQKLMYRDKQYFELYFDLSGPICLCWVKIGCIYS